ncbi:MAG TPA: hypothetical protein VEQ63_06450 [Bryobacteraceae bacterium]|nr:hypothetical protein [Bryobacteraceae bacterium]
MLLRKKPAATRWKDDLIERFSDMAPFNYRSCIMVTPIGCEIGLVAKDPMNDRKSTL